MFLALFHRKNRLADDMLLLLDNSHDRRLLLDIILCLLLGNSLIFLLDGSFNLPLDSSLIFLLDGSLILLLDNSIDGFLLLILINGSYCLLSRWFPLPVSYR